MGAWVRAAVLTIVAGMAGGLSATPPQRAVDTFRSGREILTIETTVRDAAGKPIADLQAADFTVRIDGETRTVLTAHRFGGEGTGAESTAAAPAPAPARFTAVTDTPPGRVVVFAVDRDSIRPGGEKAALDTAAGVLGSLAPGDAAGAIGFPGKVVDLTRDRKAIADAIRAMTGTMPKTNYQHYVSWEEAVAYDRGDAMTIARVLERECTKDRPGQLPICRPEVAQQAKDMVFAGRAHADTLLAGVASVLDQLRAVRAPKRLVLISGGIPLDVELLPRYQALAARAAEAHVALSVVHLDQPSFDIANSFHASEISGGREYEAGLATIASITGGDFFTGVGKTTGVFQRIATDITSFYQLGVESRPSDADGKAHKVEVTVKRSGAAVRAPASTALVASKKDADPLPQALASPTDVAELPLSIASYATHSSDPEKIRMVLAAQMGEGPGVVPSDWGYVLLQGSTVVASSKIHVGAQPREPWAATLSLEIPPGRYRLRVAAAAVDGRIATLEIPLVAGLRASGTVQASDVIVGTSDEGRLQPRSQVRADEHPTAMIEMTSSEVLTDTKGVVLLSRAGSTDPVARVPLKLRTRSDDKSIVVGEAALDLTALPPGAYTASALLDRAGTPFMRVSRMFEVLPATTPTPTAATAAAAVPASGKRDSAVDDVMQRVGRYVDDYGEQASLIVGVEHYEQQIVSALPGEQNQRRTVAEYALVRTSDATGWSGFRDVSESDARRINQRSDRLESLFHGGSGDLAEARRIADESARYNIGMRRNFNDPTVALFFMTLQGQRRFSFARKRETTIDGVAVLEIDYKETARPTMIRTTVGTDVPCEGTLWVIPADGTVVRTRLALSRFSGPSSSSIIDVNYARDPRLGLWLPTTMKEHHDADLPTSVGGSNLRNTRASTRRMTVSATAVYSDFKRFETTAKIK